MAGKRTTKREHAATWGMRGDVSAMGCSGLVLRSDWFGWRMAFYTAQSLRPHLSLLFPVMHLGDWTNVSFQDWIATIDGSWEIWDGLLDVRCQVVEPHDLGHAGRGDLTVVSQFALVDDESVANELAAVMGEG